MASSNSASSVASNSGSPCAACKFLRRKCLPGCIFAPFFPPEEPHKFANVHKIFGASNVTKLLNELLPHQREDAVNSLAYEAEARIKDPVYGCVGAISVLQRQVQRLQKELDQANAELLRYACGEIGPTLTGLPVVGSVNIGGYGDGAMRASSIVRHLYEAQARAQVEGTSVTLPLAYNSTSCGAWRGGGGGSNSSANSNASLDHKEGGDSI
ncbi:protein LATERAL ORGAN BOUNDARIES-like isoform X1 [Carex littledalei]|uniref:Protein LATERAL ORGAN BOUNDARIES-like isoform X1 n=1 Tax=Carex littledalei TaxID=544730 RepID=A0A833QVJ6_9POAL|nr:protein LATERAL ORGAN BOUNDARIES-like isoform X1 [Carex littledalei]